jgi:hypothetical protein
LKDSLVVDKLPQLPKLEHLSILDTAIMSKTFITIIESSPNIKDIYISSSYFKTKNIAQDFQISDSSFFHNLERVTIIDTVGHIISDSFKRNLTAKAPKVVIDVSSRMTSDDNDNRSEIDLEKIQIGIDSLYADPRVKKAILPLLNSNIRNRIKTDNRPGERPLVSDNDLTREERERLIGSVNTFS